MKNKVALITSIFVIASSLTPLAYCQPITYDLCSSDTETPDCNVDCGVYDAYPYVSLGVGPIIFIPNVGIGYRARYAQLGWDTALNFSTLGYVHQLGAHFVGHYYLSPSRQNSGYLGLGVMGSGVFTNHEGVFGTLSPDFVFGKQLTRSGNSRHFIEMHIGVPTMLMSSDDTASTAFPLMYVKYGIGF